MFLLRDLALVALSMPILLAQTPAPAPEPQSQQAPAPAPAPPAPSPWSLGPIEFSGLIDGYADVNFNHPQSRTNQLRNFDVRSDSFSLNMAKIEMQHSPDPVGFRLDIGFGRAFDIFHATEPLTNGQNVFEHIMQGYVSVKPKDWGGFQFDFGKFFTSAGAEVTETHLNWNYSRALLYANGPYYHFGLRTSKPITSWWTGGFQIVNGWNNVEDQNSGKTFGFTSVMTGKKVSWANTYLVGPEKPNTNAGYRHFWDTVLTLTPSDKAAFYLNFDYGNDKVKNGTNNPFWGVSIAHQYSPNSWFALSPRFEYYQDSKGFITGTPQALKEFTLTASFKMKEGFMTRVEYRRDWSNRPFFDKGAVPGDSNSQSTILIGFMAYFGPKR